MQRDVCPTCGGDVVHMGHGVVAAYENDALREALLFAEKLLRSPNVNTRMLGADLKQIIEP